MYFINVKKYAFLLFFIYCSASFLAQPKQQNIKIIFAPNHTDWTYNLGESAEFTITVLKNNIPIENAEIYYTIKPDFGYKEIKSLQEGKLILKNRFVTVKTNKVHKPIFLRCKVTVTIDGKAYSSYATAGFSPEKIEPTVQLPSDFEFFGKKRNTFINESFPLF